jgi:hypothetical protein
VAKKTVNPRSPWRKPYGGLGPLSEKTLIPGPEEENTSPIPGVLDVECFETPSRLTKKDLEELL